MKNIIIGIFVCILLIGATSSAYVLTKQNNPIIDQLIAPQISIEKTVDFDGNGIYTDQETNTIGTTAYWKIIVTNIGNEPVYDINITDTNGVVFGPFNLLNNGNMREFTYSMVITQDTFNEASAIWEDAFCTPFGPVCDTAEVIVICEHGCTLTWGYWKNHNIWGSAWKKADDTWYELSALGPDTLFFGTTHTYMDILNMSSAGGNAYIILAHQYIAARLNELKEDNPPLPGFISQNKSNAEVLLIQYQDSMYISNRNIEERVNRIQAIVIASILGNFNEGRYSDWPHCE